MRKSLIAILLAPFIVSACYQSGGEIIAAGEGSRVEGVRDGLYRRPDGSEIVLRWNGHDQRYDVGRTGHARVKALANGLWLIDYDDSSRLVIVAGVDNGDLLIRQPAPATEARLLKAYGLTIKPGPVNGLVGSADAIRGYLAELSRLQGTPELETRERVGWVEAR